MLSAAGRFADCGALRTTTDVCALELRPELTFAMGTGHAGRKERYSGSESITVSAEGCSCMHHHMRMHHHSSCNYRTHARFGANCCHARLSMQCALAVACSCNAAGGLARVWRPSASSSQGPASARRRPSWKEVGLHWISRSERLNNVHVHAWDIAAHEKQHTSRAQMYPHHHTSSEARVSSAASSPASCSLHGGGGHCLPYHLSPGGLPLAIGQA